MNVHPVNPGRRRLALALAAAPLAGCAAAPHGAPAPAGAGALRDLSGAALAQAMVPGINLGNTLEALPHETAWGNPPANRALMEAYRAAGMRSVRIPVAWFAHADAQDRVHPAWMARVQQVVDSARQAGLIVLLNAHWDNGWLDQPFYAHQARLQARLAHLWQQVGTAFRDHDEGLLFAGTNEVHVPGQYTLPTAENAAVQNSFNQTFVSAVRATGGGNARRHLVVQAYNTSIAAALTSAVLPSDTVEQRLMMEVHYYDPFDFALNNKSTVWQWGATATDPAATRAGADEPWIEQQFSALRRHFVDRGVPVLMGEYGAYEKPAYPGMRPFVHHWIRAVTTGMRRHGIVPMWWDTGALFDRRTGAQRDPATIRLIVESAR